MQGVKRGIKAALIDDGVNEVIDSVFTAINRCYVEKGRLYQGSAVPVPPLSHGTICAAVIASKETDIELLDIRIFENGIAEIEDLITALEYCMSYGVQVINLSCGTLNYLEYKKVERTLYKLRRRNVMIVSAFSNQRLVSFPAGCQGVFGVRADFGKCLKRGEYGFQEFTGGRLENSIVAHIGTVTIEDSKLEVMANSYAAPVITGEIVRILKKDPAYTFKSVLRQLIQCGIKEGCQGRPPKKCLSGLKKEISVPVLGIDRRCRRLKNFMQRKLREDGYYVTTVSEYGWSEAEIPCKYYMDSKRLLDRDVIYTIEYIYDPDIIIFFLNNQRFCTSEILDMVDIRISKMRGSMELHSKEDLFIVRDYSKIYEYVIHFFAE